MTYTTTYVPSRAVPPAIAPYADPLNILFTENCWTVGYGGRGVLTPSIIREYEQWSRMSKTRVLMRRRVSAK